MSDKLPEACAEIGQVTIPKNWDRCIIRMPEISSDVRIFIQASGYMATHRREGEVTIAELVRIKQGGNGQYFQALIKSLSGRPDVQIEFTKESPGKRIPVETIEAEDGVPFLGLFNRTRGLLKNLLQR